MLIKDTESQASQSAWFVIEDINRRAEAAYDAHVELFTSDVHMARVEAVVGIMRQYFAGWEAIYQTARAKTRVRGAHTEVKFNRVVLNRARRRADFLAALAAVGVDTDCVVCKPATESYSVHVK
jgi:N-acyl-L-homoserine lactone synthetase